MTAARAGRIRWLAARREAKAAGLPVPRMGRIPGRRRGEAIEVSRARVAVKDELRGLAAVKPVAETDHAEMFDHLTGLALREAVDIFNLPTDPDALKPLGLDAQKVKRMKMEMAQSIMATRVKVDEGSLRHQERGDLIELWREELKNIKIPSKCG
jgi:hypothetical protein